MHDTSLINVLMHISDPIRPTRRGPLWWRVVTIRGPSLLATVKLPLVERGDMFVSQTVVKRLAQTSNGSTMQPGAGWSSVHN